MYKRIFLIVLFTLVASSFGGTAFAADKTWSTNTILTAGTYQYDNCKVNSGVTLTFDSASSGYTNAAPPKPVILKCKTLIVDGVIAADGTGFRAQQGPGASPENVGASYGGKGGSLLKGKITYYSGPTYGDSELKTLYAGSSGGNGYYVNSGGRGGGIVVLEITEGLTINGRVSANGMEGYGGGHAWRGAPGGGSGGSVYISAGSITGTGVIEAKGGQGGYGYAATPGSGGGGGRIALFSSSMAERFKEGGAGINLSGGLANGGNPGGYAASPNPSEPGTYYGLIPYVAGEPENPALCRGRIEGFIRENNGNVGKIISFDSHDGAANYQPADLSIVGLTEPGKAPAYQGYAACVAGTEEISNEFLTRSNKQPLTEEEYVLKGFTWADNIGFISFYCGDDRNNQGVNCGDYPYGVKITPSGNGSTYVLKGYGWNPSFGYINFYCKNGTDGFGNSAPCKTGSGGNVDYYVELTKSLEGSDIVFRALPSPTGALPLKTPFAFSAAGVYLNFDDLVLYAPKEFVPGDTWCQTLDSMADPVCVEIEIGEEAKVADGEESYEVFVYLRDDYGIPLSLDAITDLDIKFDWRDTVARDQVEGPWDQVLDSVEEPWETAVNGGIAYKPVSINEGDLVAEDLSLGKYKIVDGGIRSYAPTFNANLSQFSNVDLETDQRFKGGFRNETFIMPPTLQFGERNQLISKNAQYNIDYQIGATPATASNIIYANGEIGGVNLTFKPLVYVNDLRAYDNDDIITAYRDVPVPISTGMGTEGTRDGDIENEKVDLIYGQKVGGELSCLPLDFVPESNTDPDFINKFSEISRSGFTDYEFMKAVFDEADFPGLFTLNATIADQEVDPEGEPQVPEENYCAYADSPFLYTAVSYDLDGNRVKYLSNKLPRLAGGLASNLAVTVHGNIYAQFASVTSSDVEPVLTSGDIILNVARDVAKRNVAKYVKVENKSRTNNANCAIRSLDLIAGSVVLPGVGGGPGVGVAGPVSVGSACKPDAKVTINAGTPAEETIVYLQNKNVTIAGNQNVSKKLVYVVDGGNLFIDGNVNYGSGGQFVALVFRHQDDKEDLGKSGNVYIDADVTDLSATVLADGSVFSWVADEDYDLNEDGEPESLQVFFNILKDHSAQLLWRGSIAARNTIGGADFLGEREKLFYKGGIPTDDKEKAQLYDLNYLRLFSLGVRIDGSGNPIDQSCGIGLTPEQISDPAQLPSGCDGIDFEAWDGEDGGTGDLIPLVSEDKLSNGLATLRESEADNDLLRFYGPVYIFYRPADSFVFKAK